MIQDCIARVLRLSTMYFHNTGLILVVWSVAGDDSRGIILEQVLSAGALRIVAVEVVVVAVVDN